MVTEHRALQAEDRPRRRRSHAAANDVVLRDISLQMLAESGLDGLSFSDLAQRSGLTRTPIYARYDSPEDVAVELWTDVLLDHLDHLMALDAEWYAGSSDRPSDELLSEFQAPSQRSAALVEVLAVARRFPYLQDVVVESFGRRVETYVAASGAPRAVAVTQLAILLGTLFLAPVVGPTVGDGWALALPVAKELLTDAEAWSAPKRDVEPVEIPLPSPTFDDEILDVFVPAIMRVISRSGYEHASANRIARETDRAFNAVYERYESKEALMESVVAAWVEDGINIALTPFIGLGADEFIERSVTSGRSIVADVNRPFRNLRNEMTLAARHHPTIAANTARLYRDAALRGRVLFDQAYEGVDDEVFLQLALIGSLVRSNGFGLCLMATCLPSLSDLDFTPASTGHQRCLARRVTSHLKRRSN